MEGDGGTDSGHEPEGRPADRAVEVRLLAQPTRLSFSERDRFRVGIVAVNTGSAPVDPELFSARLYVNGEASPAFDLALGNGVVPRGFDMIGAGETVPAVLWPLGEALFPSPASYELVLRVGGSRARVTEGAVTVVVTA